MSTATHSVARPETSSHDAECLTIRPADVARMLGISGRHLQDMDDEGLLGPEPIYFGRAKRWLLEELRAWLMAGAPNRQEWLAIRHQYFGGDHNSGGAPR